jgi:hypothetical protein
MVLRVSWLSTCKPFWMRLSHFGTILLNEEYSLDFIILIAGESQKSKQID